MTNRNESTALGADIDRDRVALASTLGALQDRVSVENLAQEALGIIRTNAASYTSSIDQAVRANPLALALTGAGLAWLVFGNKKSAAKSVRPVAMSRWEDEGGSLVLPAHTPKSSGDTEWWRLVDGLRDTASAKLRKIESGTRSFASELGSDVAGALGQAGDYASDKASVVADLVQGMKRGFVHGLDGLSDQARESIVAARERAYAARIRAERALNHGMLDTGRMIEEHPLIAGAVALAVGAALAASLPRTETEDRVFGGESDRLMDEAGRLLRQERDRLAQAAEGVTDELKESAKEAISTVSEAAVNMVDRVKERAETATAEAIGSSAPQTAGPVSAQSTAAAKRSVG